MATGDSQYPPRRSSRGIFVNLEVGVAFAKSEKPHTASLHYSSRGMRERLYLQQQEDFLRQRQLQHPPSLMPANGHYPDRNARQHQQHRQRRLTVRTREHHERGSSAPPTLSERLPPISPVSPIGSVGHIHGTTHTSNMPIEGDERPLPALPSRFRLGEDGLPWSTEPWYRPVSEGSGYETPTVVGIERENTGEDPQRVRELEELHQAMMTVDSLPHDGWEPWTWDSVGEIPRGPRSLGWAVSRDDSVFSPVSPPPPYVVSQWEEAFGLRPRSSG